MATISPAASKAYRAIWRWHFYAGLIVAPFLLILAITGSIYLFNDEIDDALSPQLRFVVPRAEQVPASAMIGAALAAHPGAATRIDLPAAANRAAVVFVSPAHGDPLRVAVDPHDGRVLGAFVYTHTLVGFADEMHGSLTLGTLGDRIVELAACWALVLIATGLYLWWPRGRRGLGGILYPRLGARGRLWWRDLHAVTGSWAVAFIAFMLFTGLPWAGIEGDLIQRGTAALGIGYPASHGTHHPPASLPMKQALGEAPWTMAMAPMPMSEHAGHAGHEMGAAVRDDAAVAGADRVTAMLARDHGLSGGYRLFLPAGATGVYTAYTYPDRPQGQRTLYIDRWSGRLIREVDFANYGWAAKGIEIGVQLHMGNYFGLANQLVMLATCLAIVVLVISGVAMWWKRRPRGQLAAPARVLQAPIAGAVAILAAASLLFPLLGASVILIVLLDRLILLARRRTTRMDAADR